MRVLPVASLKVVMSVPLHVTIFRKLNNIVN